MKELPNDLETGIYSGWASVENGVVYKAVLSLGWNPFFKNTEKSLVCISPKIIIPILFAPILHPFIWRKEDKEMNIRT